MVFYLTKDTFDAVPISVASHLKSEAESVESVLEMVGVINEKCNISKPLFLTQFTEKWQHQLRRSRLKQPYMEKLI